MLVVAGCLLGTAVVVASLVVAASLSASLADRAPERLGPIDVVVRSGTPTIGQGVLTTLRADPPVAADGLLALRQARGTLALAGGQVLPGVQLLELDFPAAAGFGADPSATGVSGSTPAPGQVVLGAATAEQLGAGPGDTVELLLAGSTRTVLVDRVLAVRGLVGFGDLSAPVALTAFVAPGLLGEIAAVAPAGSAPTQVLVLLSARGGVLTPDTRVLAAEVEQTLASLDGFEVDDVKADLLDEADLAGGGLAELLLSVAVFAVVAGMLLVAAVVALLVAQRRRTLAVLGALGLRRRDLVLALSAEGAVYGLLSCLAGAAVGAGAGALVVVAARDLFASPARGGVTLRPAVPAAALLSGALAGGLVVVGTVLVCALAATRGPIAAGLRPGAPARRGRPTDASGQGRSRWAAAGLGLALAVVASLTALAASRAATGDGPPPRVALLALPVLAAVLLTALVPGGRRARQRAAAAVAVALWAVAAVPVLRPGAGDTVFFVVQGLLLVGAATWLLAGHQHLVARAVRRVAGRHAPAALLGTAGPAAAPVRTGAVLATYALSVFTLVVCSLIVSVAAAGRDDLARDEGAGREVLVTADGGSGVEAATLVQEPGVRAVSAHLWAIADQRVPGRGREPAPWPLTGADDAWLESAPALDARAPRYADDAEAWRAVRDDPSLAVADAAYLETSGGPPEEQVAVGERIELTDPASGVVSTREVVGTTVGGAAGTGVTVSARSFGAVLLSPGSLAGAAEVASPTRFWLDLQDPGAAAELSARLERDLAASGVRAQPVTAVVDRALADQAAFFALITAFLLAALVLAVLGLAVLAARSVRARRRSLAVVLALGAPPRTLRAAVLLDGGLVAVQGVVVGALLGVLAAALMASAADDTVVLPLGQLALLVAVPVLVTLAAVSWPARQAARLVPVAALRVLE